MKIPSLFKELQYVGKAEGDRLTYHVFKGAGAYLVASPNKRGGLNVNVVDGKVPEVVAGRFGGKQVTGRLLMEKSRLFGERFASLNALYVMVALGHAHKLKRREGKAIVFKIE